MPKPAMTMSSPISQLPADAGAAADHAARADARAAGDAGAGRRSPCARRCARCGRPGSGCRAARPPRSPCRRARRGRWWCWRRSRRRRRSHAADLRHLDPAPRLGRVAEAVRADHGARVHQAALADAHAAAQRDARHAGACPRRARRPRPRRSAGPTTARGPTTRAGLDHGQRRRPARWRRPRAVASTTARCDARPRHEQRLRMQQLRRCARRWRADCECTQRRAPGRRPPAAASSTTAPARVCAQCIAVVRGWRGSRAQPGAASCRRRHALDADVGIAAQLAAETDGQLAQRRDRAWPVAASASGSGLGGGAAALARPAAAAQHLAGVMSIVGSHTARRRPTTVEVLRLGVGLHFLQHACAAACRAPRCGAR